LIMSVSTSSLSPILQCLPFFHLPFKLHQLLHLLLLHLLLLVSLHINLHLHLHLPTAFNLSFTCYFVELVSTSFILFSTLVTSCLPLVLNGTSSFYSSPFSSGIPLSSTGSHHLQVQRRPLLADLHAIGPSLASISAVIQRDG
jgi:hypothetical protein